MALTRRDFVISIPLCLLGSGACASTSQTLATGGLVELAKSTPDKAGSRTIVVFMPETSQTKEVWTGLNDELGREFQLVAVRVENATQSSVVAEALSRYQPAGIVLMNNPTVRAYLRYQQATPRGTAFPPAVIVMTSFVERESKTLLSATGISYEIPLITVMTNLRKLVKLEREKVGVVVREPIEPFVNEQIELAKREKVTVVVEKVSSDPNTSELKRALRNLKASADVLWILNDDRLLSPKLLADGWLPGLDERPWLPTIVGAGSLVSPIRSFGTFAVLPDHVALGAQAADMLLDIADNDWQLEPNPMVQLPLSTTTIMDLSQVKERFAMRDDALEQVDKILDNE